MNSIVFIDAEIEPKSSKILDIGGINDAGNSFHSDSISDFGKFLKGNEFICGHNIINHDLKYLGRVVAEARIKKQNIIDTLFLSPLLFPSRPYHALLKDDKLQTEDLNNPLNDSIKAKDLFYDEVSAFYKLDEDLKQIFYMLLNGRDEFAGFFRFININFEINNPEELIRKKFQHEMCQHSDLSKIISKKPLELAYCLALINATEKYSITPPWVLINFSEVEHIMFLLRNNPCLTGCEYCDEKLDAFKNLKYHFGFDSFREYEGEPLQEKAVKAAITDKSILVIFPTGGGKSLTFQLPALMSGISSKGLTVVISPLQSLMKDQVDNLEKIAITDAVTINGLLDPIERAKSIERVSEGTASILYISPESLRSRTIEKLLLGRNVVRFVIDEAHCFSAWGQDFRVDYLNIAKFIKKYQETKNKEEGIPVSCFTATAKPKVIEDIKKYFSENLALELEVYNTPVSRSNLNYKVIEKADDEEKYNTLRALIEEKNCSTIVYVSRTKKAYELAQRLTKDGLNAFPYHGQMDKNEKTDNQDAFMLGKFNIMVATSAFGMGVDKKDVGMVIHYDISDSLENYIQEAGRAGRDENINANCYILYNDEDLSKHFILLNQTKITVQEIQQIWKAIKDITRFRTKVSQSALELASKAGWDEGFVEIETRVKTAIAALEEAGFIKRGQNMPRVYADSILARNAMDAIKIINSSKKFDEKQKVSATRIIKMLISERSRSNAGEGEAESRIDYIADILGIPKEEVIESINLMREERILSDGKDLSAFIKKKENLNKSQKILKIYQKIERILLEEIDEAEKTYHIKELNEKIEENGCPDVSADKIIKIFNFWAIKKYIKKHMSDHSKKIINVSCLCKIDKLKEKFKVRCELAEFIVEYLFEISKKTENVDTEKEEVMVEFSVIELKEEYEKKISMFKQNVNIADVKDALFYLTRINALNIEGGFLVLYSPMSIERIENDVKRRYKAEDYEKLKKFYKNKIQQIHIVGEYAKIMMNDYKEALQFVDDYFQLNYPSFLHKYFKGSRQHEINKNITPAKFKKIFGELSPTQLRIINDKDSKYIVVAAGPGSGKTRILVHKLASLLLMEDVKHEQMLMVTFSRAAATEFKKRLIKLIGNAAYYIEIKTFHSYCFDLLGRVGSVEKSSEIIHETLQKIKNGEIETGRMTKTVLVIDEAQDMDANEFELINVFIERNEDIRVIAVGDDDQNIYEFRGSSSKHMEQLIREKEAKIHELVENYRSKSNLVDFSNQFSKRISHRLKKGAVIPVQSETGKIRIIKHISTNLVTPLVNDILNTGLKGSTCVLTKTNDEALQVNGLLLKNGLPAKLIQSNDSFSLYNLLEVRYFLEQIGLNKDIYIIDNEDWDNAKKELVKRFGDNSNLELCMNLIKDFEVSNSKKYKSDFEIFVRESNMEDFYREKTETIMVSTIHKSKGREFDNVFLLLDEFSLNGDESARQLYVALTRAKNNLTIHTNRNYFDAINTDELERIYSKEKYETPNQLAVQLSYKDVLLDFFLTHQNLIEQLNSDEVLNIEGNFCCNIKGQKVLRFSKQMIEKIDNLRNKNYIPKLAVIKHIVYWQKEDAEEENLIILPVVYFERDKDS